MTESSHLGYRDSREDAWELAHTYAALVVQHGLPLAIGVRPLAKQSKRDHGGFEVYAALTQITPSPTIPDQE